MKVEYTDFNKTTKFSNLCIGDCFTDVINKEFVYIKVAEFTGKTGDRFNSIVLQTGSCDCWLEQADVIKLNAKVVIGD